MSLATFDDDAVRAFTKSFEELFYANDAAAMTAYYTSDAQLMGEGMRPIQGHSAIGEFWRVAQARANGAGARREIEMHEASSSGDLGYVLCTVTVTLPGRTVAVWDTTVWRRGEDGRWRIVVDISTALPPQ
jgi:ketosteroid isomerase-like protein